jgi:hypothetical protein
VSAGGGPAAVRPGEMWGWANWRAWNAGSPTLGAVEYTLYTDVNVSQQVTEGLGPYQLLDTLAFPQFQYDQAAAPAVVLRVDLHLDPTMSQGGSTRNVDAYHGGDAVDELASLVSLALGARLEAGGQIRSFPVDGDPRGRPLWYDYQPPHLARASILATGGRQRLPRVADGIHLNECVPWLQRYFRLQRGQANALVRAARSYQAALWAAEDDPRQAWLKLISAVEAAAHHEARGDAPPVEQLRTVDPGLAERLEAAGGGLVEAVAERFAPGLRATTKMLNFTLKFLPPPPQPRPTSYALAWSKTKMRRHLATIYGARSQDLHAGIAVPAPMCEPPEHLVREQPPEHLVREQPPEHLVREQLIEHLIKAPLTERPSGKWTATKSSAWQAEDTPMLLHTFEYIVRNALKKWWESMDSVAAPSGNGR